MGKEDKFPRGGHGGSVKVIGESGRAEGGHGGRGGAPGHGKGGDGGGGTHTGGGYARGGDGGDAGRPARPALGAPSTMSYVDSSWLSIPGITDIYGIPQPGKGGDSYTVHVTFSGYTYCLNILLQLIRGPLPRIIERPDIIDIVDEAAISSGIETEQAWWELAVNMFPNETEVLMKHVRNCESTAPNNTNSADRFRSR